MAEIFDHIDQLRRSPGKVAVATLVNTRGTTPRKEGAKMLVGEGGSILGSVTIGGCVDAQVIEESAGVLATMQPRLLELNLGDEEAWEIGLTCGGTIEVFLEPVAFDQPEQGTAHVYERDLAAQVARRSQPGNAARLHHDGPPVEQAARRGQPAVDQGEGAARQGQRGHPTSAFASVTARLASGE